MVDCIPSIPVEVKSEKLGYYKRLFPPILCKIIKIFLNYRWIAYSNNLQIRITASNCKCVNMEFGSLTSLLGQFCRNYTAEFALQGSLIVSNSISINKIPHILIRFHRVTMYLSNIILRTLMGRF